MANVVGGVAGSVSHSVMDVSCASTVFLYSESYSVPPTDAWAAHIHRGEEVDMWAWRCCAWRQALSKLVMAAGVRGTIAVRYSRLGWTVEPIMYLVSEREALRAAIVFSRMCVAARSFWYCGFQSSVSVKCTPR
jgi:hypothetical protein